MDYLQYSMKQPDKRDPSTVLNLIINGLPSIFKIYGGKKYEKRSFKPYYKWITFNILTEGLDIVFIIERISFYMIAKFEHFSVF